MSVRALVIQPNGDCYLEELPQTGDRTLEVRQAIVGGFIEPLGFNRAPGKPYDATLWLNENGKFEYGPDGYNGLATDLVRHVLFPRDYITGPVYVTGDDGSPDDADVPEWVVAKVATYPDCRWIGESWKP